MEESQIPAKSNVNASNISSTPPIPPATNKPPRSKLAYLFIAFLILLILTIGSASAVYISKSLRPKPTLIPFVQTLTPTTNPTANWKTYINSMFGFSINYPPNWTTVPFASTDIIPGFKPIQDKKYAEPYMAALGIREGCKDSKPIGEFKQWINTNAAAEIQGRTTMKSSQSGITNQGVNFYKVIWNISPGSLSPFKTYPTAYVQLPNSINNNYCLEFDYGDPKYFSTMDQILSTFQFTN